MPPRGDPAQPVVKKHPANVSMQRKIQMIRFKAAFPFRDSFIQLSL